MLCCLNPDSSPDSDATASFPAPKLVVAEMRVVLACLLLELAVGGISFRLLELRNARVMKECRCGVCTFN